MKFVFNFQVFAILFIGIVCLTGCVSKSDAYIYSSSLIIPRSYKSIPMFECAWCHKTKNLNRHHVIPQSIDKKLKNNPDNIVILCRDCHFVLGHRCNWRKFNPDVMEIVSNYTNSIMSASYFEDEN